MLMLSYCCLPSPLLSPSSENEWVGHQTPKLVRSSWYRDLKLDIFFAIFLSGYSACEVKRPRYVVMLVAFAQNRLTYHPQPTCRSARGAHQPFLATFLVTSSSFDGRGAFFEICGRPSAFELLAKPVERIFLSSSTCPCCIPGIDAHVKGPAAYRTPSRTQGVPSQRRMAALDLCATVGAFTTRRRSSVYRGGLPPIPVRFHRGIGREQGWCIVHGLDMLDMPRLPRSRRCWSLSASPRVEDAAVEGMSVKMAGVRSTQRRGGTRRGVGRGGVEEGVDSELSRDGIVHDSIRFDLIEERVFRLPSSRRWYPADSSSRPALGFEVGGHRLVGSLSRCIRGKVDDCRLWPSTRSTPPDSILLTLRTLHLGSVVLVDRRRLID
ncbi:hypothetical protein R3P38DRAFT_3215550 [Favolaschia claudopus]|uniref:Uncharacterized protein n=1 Tax=Favolaschia claudopus TaxID=2862362 RepID=A0AAW0A7Y9_9AGAR